MTFIPSLLIEASNGVIVILLMYFIMFLVLHLFNQWVEIHKGYTGKYGWRRSLRAVYDECKPEIALFVLMSGFEMRTSVLWFARHSDNHQYNMHQLQTVAASSIVIGTAMIVLGAMCWNRVMVPFRNSFAAWSLMLFSALAFGVGMALI